MPFDIPDSWTWIRQKNICWLDNGDKVKGKKLPYLEAKVIRGKSEPTYIDTGVIVGPECKVILVDGENSGEIMTPPFEGYMGSTFKIFSAVKSFNYEFLLFIFLLNKEKYKNSKIGAAIPHLNKELFRESLIAVPPLNEQERIVAKIIECEPLIIQYSIVEEKLSKLEDEFPEKLKKSILQYAIEGKLVKQDPNDEPASVLLERIKAEKERLIKEGKIKRDKNESYIFQGDDKNYYEKIDLNIQKIDEPFDIPDHWKWVQIKDIFIHSAGKALNSSDAEGKKYPYITTSNVYWNSFVLENLKSMYYKDNEIEKCSATKGDLLVLEGGDIGRAAIWNYEYDIRIQNHIHRLRPLIDVNVDFYYLVFFLYKNSNSIEGRGIGLQGLSANRLKSLIVPLPTKKEQYKIAARINKIFQII